MRFGPRRSTCTCPSGRDAEHRTQATPSPEDLSMSSLDGPTNLNHIYVDLDTRPTKPWHPVRFQEPAEAHAARSQASLVTPRRGLCRASVCRRLGGQDWVPPPDPGNPLGEVAVDGGPYEEHQD